MTEHNTAIANGHTYTNVRNSIEPHTSQSATDDIDKTVAVQSNDNDTVNSKPTDAFDKIVSEVDKLVELGALALTDNNYNEAIQLYEQVLKLTHNDSSVHAILGVCYHLTDQTEKALEYYTKAIDLCSQSKTQPYGEWYYNRGILYSITLHDYSAAYSDMCHALIQYYYEDNYKEIDPIECIEKIEQLRLKLNKPIIQYSDIDNNRVIVYYRNQLKTGQIIKVHNDISNTYTVRIDNPIQHIIIHAMYLHPAPLDGRPLKQRITADTVYTVTNTNTVEIKQESKSMKSFDIEHIATTQHNTAISSVDKSELIAAVGKGWSQQMCDIINSYGYDYSWLNRTEMADVNGWYVQHWAAKRNKIDQCKLLHELYSIDWYIRTLDDAGDVPKGSTPLHLAVVYRNTAVIEYLCTIEPNLIKVEDSYGKTPYELCQRNNKWKSFVDKANEKLKNNSHTTVTTSFDLIGNVNEVVTKKRKLSDDSVVDTIDLTQ